MGLKVAGSDHKSKFKKFISGKAVLCGRDCSVREKRPHAFCTIGVENLSSLGDVIGQDWWERIACTVRETLTEEATLKGHLEGLPTLFSIPSYPSHGWQVDILKTPVYSHHTSFPETNMTSVPKSLTPPDLACIPPWDTSYPSLLKESTSSLLTLLKLSSRPHVLLFPSTSLKALYLQLCHCIKQSH